MIFFTYFTDLVNWPIKAINCDISKCQLIKQKSTNFGKIRHFYQKLVVFPSKSTFLVI